MSPTSRVFANRYELGDEIGHGGMADVYLAHDRLLDRNVAVKVLLPQFASDPINIERFRREAQAAAGLNHPHIVSVYDWGEEDGTSFIVMEYVAGQTLREILQSYGPLNPMDAARVAAEIADALSFAHSHGVVHRDVKPGNVLVTPQGQVKVTDFGIARADTSEPLTKSGAVLGTATDFSPVQAQGLPHDGRSDV
jgi:serine/threonine-protein kinase